MIRARDIRKSFGSIAAVDGVTFDVHRGEIFGLLGPNGAGKSTAIAMCTGQLAPESGSIEIGEAGSPRAAPARALIGLAPQQIAL